jgi:hypothetical protein
MSAQAVALDPEYPTQKPKRPLLRDVFEAGNEASGVISIVEAPKHIAEAVVIVQNGIATTATKAAVVAGNHGCHAVAAVCLKVAAAAPVIAQVTVCIAVVAVAFCIFWWLRSA